MLKLGNNLFLSAKILNALVALVAIALLIWNGVYLRKPGPKEYRSHFTGLFFSSCLIFQTVQFFLLATGRTRTFHRRWFLGLTYLYWITLTLSGFLSGVAYAYSPKPDVVALEFLTFLAGLAGLLYLALLQRRAEEGLNRDMLIEDEGHPLEPEAVSFSPTSHESRNTQSRAGGLLRMLFTRNTSSGLKPSRNHSRSSRWCVSFWRISNRFLKFLHWAFSVMFIAGAITHAMSYRFTNPGKRVQVKLLTGQTSFVNYNCTTVPSNGTFLPTIWLESSDAHGVVDFLGVQQAFAVRHGRNSCSYDPPNFGWSDNLPSDLSNTDGYFKPLLKALNKEDEAKVIIGKEDGGHRGLIHANEDPETTKAFVMLNVFPDGIEFFDEQRKRRWTEKQMLDYRAIDLSGRIFLTQIVLALGIPWGIIPIFIPNDPKNYFNKSLYARYRSQAFKDDFWAMQHLQLLRMASQPIDNYLANTTVPAGMPTYAVLSKKPIDTVPDEGSNAFYLASVLDLANHVAGGELTLPPVYCTEDDCSQGFLGERVADVIMSLPI